MTHDTDMVVSRQWQSRPADERFTSLTALAAFASFIIAAHTADEGRPIETVWDVVTGATAYARSITHQDNRVLVERTAGKLLQMAA